MPVLRFEDAIFNNLKNHNHQSLQQQFGEFYLRFIENIMQFGEATSPESFTQLQHFTSDKEINQIYEEVNKSYQDFSVYERELKEAFKHYKYYFPDSAIPQIITFISGFNYQIAVTKNQLAIGLDMYLGSNFWFYHELMMPTYKVSKLTSNRMVYDALRSWLQSSFILEAKNPEMVDKMIHSGKILYAMQCLFPNSNDSLLINYTPGQIEWCNNNEFNIWAHFIDNKLLYSKIPGEYFKFFNEGPFTSGFPQESPPRTGEWMGWQIVKKYMKQNNQVTLQQLFNEKNSHLILQKSSYKPQKI